MERDKGYKPIIHICASSEVFGKIQSKEKPETGIHEECPFHPAHMRLAKLGQTC